MLNAYGTIIGKPFRKQLRTVLERFEEDHVTKSGLFLPVRGSSKIFKIAPGTTGIPQWDMPYSVTVGGEQFTLIDTRPFERANGTVTKDYEVRLMENRAYLEHTWNFAHDEYTSVMPILIAGYSEWMRSIIRSRFNIDETQDTIYRLFFAFYYWQLGLAASEIEHIRNEDLQTMFTKFAIRNLRVAGPFVTAVTGSQQFVNLCLEIQKLNTYVSLDTTLYYANQYVDSPAINIDTAALIQLAVTASWMGHTAQVIAAGAVEYPGLFAHMAGQAVSLGIYRRTVAGRAIEAVGRQGIKVDEIKRWSSIIEEEILES